LRGRNRFFFVGVGDDISESEVALPGDDRVLRDAELSDV
jgi:hypothetical protein